MSEEKPLNIPEYLLLRSAEARAKALGISVEQALADIKGVPVSEVSIEEPVTEEEPAVEEEVVEVVEANLENKTVESIPAVTIRFAGDSGDGMQLVGTRFTDTSALFGNDLATLPAFPAEIRAPQGTVAGVSSFQVQIADFDILTPGDAPDVLLSLIHISEPTRPY